MIGPRCRSVGSHQLLVRQLERGSKPIAQRPSGIPSGPRNENVGGTVLPDEGYALVRPALWARSSEDALHADGLELLNREPSRRTGQGDATQSSWLDDNRVRRNGAPGRGEVSEEQPPEIRDHSGG